MTYLLPEVHVTFKTDLCILFLNAANSSFMNWYQICDQFAICKRFKHMWLFKYCIRVNVQRCKWKLEYFPKRMSKRFLICCKNGAFSSQHLFFPILNKEMTYWVKFLFAKKPSIEKPFGWIFGRDFKLSFAKLYVEFHAIFWKLHKFQFCVFWPKWCNKYIMTFHSFWTKKNTKIANKNCRKYST